MNVLLQSSRRLPASFLQGRTASVPHDREHPGAAIFTPESIEGPECAQVCFLYSVLDVVFVLQESPCDAIGCFQMRKHEPLEARPRAGFPHFFHPTNCPVSAIPV